MLPIVTVGAACGRGLRIAPIGLERDGANALADDAQATRTARTRRKATIIDNSTVASLGRIAIESSFRCRACDKLSGVTN